MGKRLDPGTVVIFIDEYRRKHNALVTECHGDPEGRGPVYKRDDSGKLVLNENGIPITEKYDVPGSNWPCVNLTYVSTDPKKTDNYGRQLERDATSMGHLDDNGSCASMCFCFPDEEEKADRMIHEAVILAEARRKESEA